MITSFLQILFYTVSVFILANVVISYFPAMRRHPIGQFFYTVSEVILSPVRKVIPPLKIDRGVSMDLAPLIAYFVVWILYKVLLGLHL